MDKLIVGLGNPGNKYEKTRHNIGMMVLDHLEFTKNLVWQKKFKGLYAAATIEGHRIHFVRPQTFMNLSGESVMPAAQYFHVPAEEILVIHDELDYFFGHLSFKKGGGLAGHNGLKSIAGQMGTQDFMRLRMGIGRPENKSENAVSAWVLSPFSKIEQEQLDEFLKLGSQAVYKYIIDGIEKASTSFNKKKIAEKK